MYAIRSYYGSNRDAGGDHHVVGVVERRAVVVGDVAGPVERRGVVVDDVAVGDGVTGADGGRITSYNVCYTKLLRSAGSAPFFPIPW